MATLERETPGWTGRYGAVAVRGPRSWLFDGPRGLLDPVLMLFVLVLNVCDLLLTFTMLPMGAEELNPIFSPLFAEGRWTLAAFIKLTPFAVIFAATAYLVRRLGYIPRLVAWSIRFLFLEYTAVVAFLTGQLVPFWLRSLA